MIRYPRRASVCVILGVRAKNEIVDRMVSQQTAANEGLGKGGPRSRCRYNRSGSVRQGVQPEVLPQPVAQGIVDIGWPGLEPLLVDHLYLPALN